MAHTTALVHDDATTRPTNVFEVKARSAKAAKLADVLVLHGATATTAACLPTEARKTCAALAGVRQPSPATWDLVVELVRVVERNREGLTLAERLYEADGEQRPFWPPPGRS